MHDELAAPSRRYPHPVRVFTSYSYPYCTTPPRFTPAFVRTLSFCRLRPLALSSSFRHGSSASRPLSPNTCKDSTVSTIAPPARLGGCVPRPRKLSDAPTIIDVPTLRVEVAMRGAMSLGRLCRHNRCQSRTARALAASMAVRIL